MKAISAAKEKRFYHCFLTVWPAITLLIKYEISFYWFFSFGEFGSQKENFKYMLCSCVESKIIL
jgi:hypothetical protein